ncbi:uncharacterized protein LOC115633402 [Scaptodrosophila lebanonensis]|uniref:Uncharacterized protein LOC115633402 n=1 Tax=Drosophila lebanonensis TaxID=7225 RepID=A0A6J2UEC0_DROLE|nr:uncharacterized protein LOC115633402 [Scaptodrosophila lebanonensis]
MDICDPTMGLFSRHMLRLCLVSAMLHLAVQYCYVMKILGQRVWDTPKYELHMILHEKNNSLSSVTIVHEDVQIPLWHLTIMQHPRGRSGRVETARTLYNSTTKTCEFFKYIKRVRVFNNVAQLMLSSGSSNLSLDCPLKAGVYALNVIQVPPDTGLLKFMYHPNTIYTLHGTVYSLSPKDGVTKTRLCRYEVNGTIFKTC